MFKKIILTVLLVCSFESAFGKRIDDLIQKAESGDPIAQYQLGKFYLEADNIENNLQNAFDWFSLSAEQGYAKSQSELGRMYAIYLKDKETALIWYQKSAEQNDSDGQFYLGMDYLANSQKYNPEQALFWLEKSAKQGNVNAQYNLGDIYRQGRKQIQPDIQKALYWYQKASENGETTAFNHLIGMYYNGEGIKQDFNQSFYWLKQAEKAGAPDGYLLGKSYYYGQGTERNIELAKKWIEKECFYGVSNQNEACELLLTEIVQFKINDSGQSSNITLNFVLKNPSDQKLEYKEALNLLKTTAKQGNPEAIFYFYQLHRRKYNEEKKEAIRFLEEIANNGTADAMFYLYEIYEEDNMMLKFSKNRNKEQQRKYEQNEKEALFWLNQAGKNGNENAQFILKEEAFQKWIKNKNLINSETEKLFNFYQRLAEKNHRKAQYNLAIFYLLGLGIEVNEKEALNWLMKYTENNLADTEFFLGKFYLDNQIDLKQSEKWLVQSCDKEKETACVLLLQHF